MLTIASTSFASQGEQMQPSNCVQLLSSTPNAINIRCDLTDLKMEAVEVDNELKSSISIAGEPTTYYPGKPVLPAVTRFVVVPANSNLELIVTPSEPRRVRGEHPPLLLKAEEGETAEVEISEGIFPPLVAEMESPFIIRGVRMVKITSFPVRYDFRTNEYLHYETINTEIRSVPGEAVNPSLNPIRKNRSREFLSFIKDFAINGDQVGRDDPDFDSAPRYAGHYLVVMHENCLPFVIPFIEWRRKAGYKMDILSLSSGDAGSSGTVRARIQARYDAYIDNHEDPFEYLLLVGDRTNYENAPAAQWILESPTGVSNWANAFHGEYEYACLEGNDMRPDVAWGRWPAGSQAPLELAVGRTLGYEATPDMEHRDWFTRGAVYSQHWGNTAESAWHTSIPTNVRWGASVLKQQGFDDIRFYENFDWDRIAEALAPFLRRQFNERTNIMIGRAEIYWWTTRGGGHSFNDDINANTVFPLNVSCSGHGEWGAEVMYRTGNGQNLKGYVTTTNGWGGAPTQPWNFYWLEMVSGILQRGLSTGWSYNRALNVIEKYFPQNFQVNGRDGFQLTRTDLNHFGDPGLLAWMGVPRVVQMEVTRTITNETRLVEVIVHLPNSEEPVPGATVTLYAPGNIPLGNPGQYANYNQILSMVSTTDNNGRVSFVLTGNERFVNGSRVYLTTTGRDIKPEFSNVMVAVPDATIDLGAWNLDEITGNGDEFVNPGESFWLGFNARNLGNRNALQGVTATVFSNSPYVQIDDHNPVSFGDIEAGGNVEGDSRVVLTFSPVCPDGVARPITKPLIEVVFRSGDIEFKSALIIQPRAPHLEFRRVFIGNNPITIIPDSLAQIDIEIANIGSIASPADLVAELHTLGMGVTVIEGVATYPGIGAGRTSRLGGNARFDISGNKVVVPGSKTKMMLLLRTDNEILDTTYFELQVMQPRNNAPIGPDPYGYICFDDTDAGWDVAPEYEWIEINPNLQDAQFDGNALDFTGQSREDIGEALVVNMGFETQFYGEIFNQITVCTNGFIGLGSQPRIVNYQRWPMNEAIGGAAGNIAPFWNDLRLGQGSGVFYYHDTSDSRAIIQFHRMRFGSGGDAEATFQVHIYDHAVWITETGDQNILFQYKTISNPENMRGNDQAFGSNIPYASVGISSPNGRSGINYTWNNIYPTGAAPLAPRRAILFSTSPRFKSGILYGRVTDAQTGWPVEGAMVYTKHGFIANTDQDGYWRIAEALAEVPFDMTARKQGYNDSTYFDLQVTEHDSLETNFDLLHPEFNITHDFLGSNLVAGQNIELGFSLTNTGNGPMDWNAEKRLLGDANAEPWEIRRRYNVGQITDDDRIEGVIFAQDKFFLSGANEIDSANLIYVLDREGELLNRFEQIGSSRYGYKDMDWDGNYLWAAGEDSIYCLTTDGQVVTSWPDPLNPSQYIAYNSEEGILYLCGTTTSTIVRCDLEGHVLEGALSRRSLRMYGLGYWPEDPDGYDLYIVNHPSGTPTNITKMNVATGDTMFVFEIPQDSSSSGQQSAWITNEFDVYSWVFMSIQNVSAPGGGDRIEIHQLDARKDWLNLDVWTGRLETGETQDFTLTLNATNLPDTLFQGEVLFRHNADDGEMRLAIELDVIGPLPPEPFELMYPEDGDTLTALPLHGDTLRLPAVTFAWLPSHDPNDLDYVDYEFTIETGDASVSFDTADTTLTLSLDTLALPIWFDQPIRWSVTARSGDDIVSCLRTFVINILPNDIDREKLEIPVEFGLGPVYPNPFNSRTTIRFGIDKAAPATLRIYDLTGRVVADLYSGQATVGYHRVSYDGVALPSGIYWLRLESVGRIKVEKIALVR